MFFAKATRIQVGLRPAEVGYITMPAACSPKTAPGNGYLVNFDIQVKRLSKTGQRIRQSHGGGAFDPTTMKPEKQKLLQDLQQLSFSVDTGGKKNHLQDVFEVLGKAGIAKLRVLQPEWVNLWTMDDYMDQARIFRMVAGELMHILPKMNRHVLFQPLFHTNQTRFRECGYALQVAEAIFITKIMTLVIERVAQTPLEKIDPRNLPVWLAELAKLLYQKKDIANQPPILVQRVLYPAIVFDTVMYAFTMVKTVLGQDFGTEQQMRFHAEMLAQALVNQTPLDFTKVYFPLIAAGVIANPQISMPNEQVRETISMLAQTVQQRMPEKTPDNAFIFDILDNLIQRALEHF
jgi:hypothetical protein